jgi:hypothetical protein
VLQRLPVSLDAARVRFLLAVEVAVLRPVAVEPPQRPAAVLSRRGQMVEEAAARQMAAVAVGGHLAAAVAVLHSQPPNQDVACVLHHLAAAVVALLLAVAVAAAALRQQQLRSQVAAAAVVVRLPSNQQKSSRRKSAACFVPSPSMAAVGYLHRTQAFQAACCPRLESQSWMSVVETSSVRIRRAVVAEARERQMVVPARPSHCPSVETCHCLVVVAAVVAVHQWAGRNLPCLPVG